MNPKKSYERRVKIETSSGEIIYVHSGKDRGVHHLAFDSGKDVTFTREKLIDEEWVGVKKK